MLTGFRLLGSGANEPRPEARQVFCADAAIRTAVTVHWPRAVQALIAGAVCTIVETKGML